MSEDWWSIFVWSALFIPLYRVWVLIMACNIIGRNVGARSHRSLRVWVDVVSFQRSVPLVVGSIRVLLWPNLFNTALALLCNFLDSGRLAGDNIKPSPAKPLILVLSGVRRLILIISFFIQVRSNQIVRKWLIDDKTCRINVLLKVRSFRVRFDHRSAFCANDVANVKRAAFRRHVLLGVSDKHSLIWI